MVERSPSIALKDIRLQLINFTAIKNKKLKVLQKAAKNMRREKSKMQTQQAGAGGKKPMIMVLTKNKK